MTPLEALVALNMLPRIGPVRVRRLLEAFGDAAAVLGAPTDRLMRIDGIGEETAKILRGWQDHSDPAAEIREATERGIAIVTQDDEGYPAPLREAYDPPLLLYVWGKLETRDRHALGVVGSRRATVYGRQATKKLSYQLAQAGFTIVSGLARGIDTAAHEAAIAASGRTIAVIGGRVAPAGPAAPALPMGYAPPPEAAVSAYPPPPEFSAAAYGPPPGITGPESGFPPPDAEYVYAPDSSPPPPPAFDGYVAVQGQGQMQPPGTFAYAYESADGGAFAWRYDTPNGPAWAYAYETPEGWAYAYAYDTAPEGPPPAAIPVPAPEIHHEHHGGPYRGPYVEYAEHGHAGFHADRRYTDELRLYGESYPRMLYLVQTYYRESEWRTVSAVPGRAYIGAAGGCGACGGARVVYPADMARPRGVFYGGGSAGGYGGAIGFNRGYASGAALTGRFSGPQSGDVAYGGGYGGGAVSDSASFNVSNTASQTAENYAMATGNQTVTVGGAFAPPSGAPIPPWGPPAQISGGNTANAYGRANANVMSNGAANVTAGRPF